nr:nucleosome assembly protein 1-like 1-B [Halyomorpha halys]
MNVTVKTIRKRQRHKSRGAVRTILKTVQNDSFFNFFNPPQVPENGEIDDETQALLTSDFEIGHYIREKIIPHAVLYFTGEALDDEDFDSNSSMGDGSESEELDAENIDEEDDEDDEDDDDLEEIVDSGTANQVESNREVSKNAISKRKNKQPQECAQQ